MKQSNIKIAVTGGIGSGKSTVCNILGDWGYPVISFDKIYAELLTDKQFILKLKNQFGESIVNADGELNRKALSSLVFADESKLKKLNELTHPQIFSEAFSRAKNFKGIVFFEVPVLFEGGYENMFDDVIIIERDLQSRVEGVKLRDNISCEEVEKRIKIQYNYNNCNFAQYYVIHNNSKIDDLPDIIGGILLQITKKYGA